MKLGELLASEGLITAEQLDEALRLQRQLKGARVGSILVELGYVDVDTVSRALSGQLRVPAVLTKHVMAIDPKIIAAFPARVATSLHAIPLGYSATSPKRLIVALRDPSTTPLEEIAFIAGMRVDPGVAPELLIRRCLERYYGVKSEQRRIDIGIGGTLNDASESWIGVEVRKSARPPSAHEIPEDEGSRARRSAPASALTLEAPDRLSAPPTPAPATPAPSSPAAREAELRALQEAIEEESHRWDDVPSATPSHPPIPRDLSPVFGVEDALEALTASANRDEIGETLTSWLAAAFGAGLVLIVKDGMALGWKGYARDVPRELIESIAMPLGPRSMLSEPYEQREPFVGPPPAEGMALQSRLWKLLRCPAPSEVIVAPVVLGKRVVNLLYAHPDEGAAIEPTAKDDIVRVTNAASAEYARLIRGKR